MGARPVVAIVGAGFGGLECARSLRNAPVDVLVFDRKNHHCFQPLLYQVATAALAPNDVAWPVRVLLRGQPNATTLLAEVTGVDLTRGVVLYDEGEASFDYLVLATGATHSYFGHDQWAPFAPGLKRIEDATAIRRRLLLSFEEAELAPEAAQEGLLTFVIVGGGATGVEMAGAIAEMARQTLARDFRRINPMQARVVLIEAGARLLASYPETLSAYTSETLRKKGVEVLTDTAVTSCDAGGVDTAKGRIPSKNVIWAAGVRASDAALWVGAERDRSGRALVSADLSIPGRPNVFIIGDAASVKDSTGKAVPGTAPAAKQMATHVARIIRAEVAGKVRPVAFHYRHQGDLATIGRNAAVVRIGRLTLTGFAGWLFWSFAHIYFLIGARNRIAVAFNWMWDYLTFQRSVRLIN